MGTLMGAILRSAYRKENQPLNILTFPTHERYESGLALTGHNFYSYRSRETKDWNTIFAPLPANYTLLPPEKEPPVDIQFDLVLSQNKFGQYQIARRLSRLYHCPLISLEHTLPVPQWDQKTRNELKTMEGEVNVFISEFSVKEWGFSPWQSVVIHHGVDTELFQPSVLPRQNHLLSVVNQWRTRDWCCGYSLWEEVTKDLPVCVVGDTPGLSKAPDNLDELVAYYQQSQIFVNTSLVSPVPTALLEAMSCGCAVVSTATCMIPEIIINGVNGLISNDPKELREHCQFLLKNTKFARKIGAAARKTIEEKFPMKNFVENWNNLFHYTADNVFVKEQ